MEINYDKFVDLAASLGNYEFGLAGDYRELLNMIVQFKREARVALKDLAAQTEANMKTFEAGNI